MDGFYRASCWVWFWILLVGCGGPAQDPGQQGLAGPVDDRLEDLSRERIDPLTGGLLSLNPVNEVDPAPAISLRGGEITQVGTDGQRIAGPPCGGQGVGDAILWYNGHGAYRYPPEANFTNHMIGLGASAVDDLTVWPAGNLLDYRIVMLIFTEINFNAAEKAEIQAFLDAGGLLAMIGDNTTLLGWTTGGFNDLNAYLGNGTVFTGGGLDSGCGWVGNVVNAHALTANFAWLEYGLTSNMTLDPAATELVQASGGHPLIAVENNIIMTTDVNMLKSCTLQPGNYQFMTNMWDFQATLPGNGGGGPDTDGDTVPDACDV